MPPPLEDVSDDESTGGSIPFNNTEVGKKGDENAEMNDAGDDDDDEEEEGVYIVEKIMGHDFAKNGTLMLAVKWKGYEDPADQTLEPEPNLIEGAKDVVEEYYRVLGGRPEPPPSEPKKRKSTGRPKAAEKPQPQAKRARKSRGATDTETPPATDDGSDPPDWMPKTKNWENEVERVETIIRDQPSGNLIAYLDWKNGKKSKVSIDLCYDRCPKKMLNFYEQHLVFKDS